MVSFEESTQQRKQTLSRLLHLFASEYEYQQGMHEVASYLLFVLETDLFDVETSTKAPTGNPEMLLPSNSSSSPEHSHPLSDDKDGPSKQTDYRRAFVSDAFQLHDCFIMLEALLRELGQSYGMDSIISSACDDAPAAEAPPPPPPAAATTTLSTSGNKRKKKKEQKRDVSTVEDMGYNIIAKLVYVARDKNLYTHMQSFQVPPELFSTRWTRLLFAREVNGWRQVLLLWDVFFDLVSTDRTVMSKDYADDEDVVGGWSFMQVLEMTAACHMWMEQDRLLRAKETHEVLEVLINTPPHPDISQLVFVLLESMRCLQLHSDNNLGPLLPPVPSTDVGGNTDLDSSGRGWNWPSNDRGERSSSHRRGSFLDRVVGNGGIGITDSTPNTAAVGAGTTMMALQSNSTRRRPSFLFGSNSGSGHRRRPRANSTDSSSLDRSNHTVSPTPDLDPPSTQKGQLISASNKLAALLLSASVENNLFDSFSCDDSGNADADKEIDDTEDTEALDQIRVDRVPIRRPAPRRSVTGMNHPLRTASLRMLMDNRNSLSSLISNQTGGSSDTDNCDASLGPDDVEAEERRIEEILAALDFTAMEPRSSISQPNNNAIATISNTANSTTTATNNNATRGKRISFSAPGFLTLASAPDRRKRALRSANSSVSFSRSNSFDDSEPYFPNDGRLGEAFDTQDDSEMWASELQDFSTNKITTDWEPNLSTVLLDANGNEASTSLNGNDDDDADSNDNDGNGDKEDGDKELEIDAAKAPIAEPGTMEEEENIPATTQPTKVSLQTKASTIGQRFPKIFRRWRKQPTVSADKNGTEENENNGNTNRGDHNGDHDQHDHDQHDHDAMPSTGDSLLDQSNDGLPRRSSVDERKAEEDTTTALLLGSMCM